MRLGVLADIHGNEVALRAVLDDAENCQVDRWWAVGDLVLFGPRPVEALEILRSLPGIEMLRGNTDRYVLTGEQPAPHATAAKVEQRTVPFDVDAVVRDLRARLQPNAEFLESILTGQRSQRSQHRQRNQQPPKVASSPQ